MSSTPSAARWLVLDDAGDVRAVDIVADLLALDPRTKLRSRDGDRLRATAAAVEQLVGAGAVCPSGRPLLEVVVPDAEDHAAVVPAMDLDMLLSGEAPVARATDRTIRLAGHLVERAAEHRAGTIDLHAAVAPPGQGRHPAADTVESHVERATADVRLPADPAAAVVTLDGGWLGASPFELFVTATHGMPPGPVADAVGEGLARWFDGWVRGPDPWRQPLLDRVAVDAEGLLHDAATRAGSDHPTVLGGVLAEQVGMRYRI